MQMKGSYKLVLTVCFQSGDAAAIPRLESMLLLATDALCVFNKPSGISVQVRLNVCPFSAGLTSPSRPQGGTSTHAHIDAWAMAAHSAAAPWAMPLSPRLVHRLDKGRQPPPHHPPSTSTCKHTLDVWHTCFDLISISSDSLCLADTSGVLVMAKGRFVNFRIFFFARRTC